MDYLRSSQMTTGTLWSSSFLFALGVGLIIQLFLLPVVFRPFHAEHGLLLGNDSIWFYRLAVDLSRQIRTDGWGVWELRPFGQAPAGIMAAVFVFLPAEPWAVLPLYAALFATSTALLFLCLRACGFTNNAAALGVLPLLIFPSGAILYALPHKDAFSMCGSMMFLWSLLRLGVAGQGSVYGEKWGLAASFLFGIVGGFLVWVVRPYAVEVMMGAGGVIALLITGLFLFRLFRRRWRLVHESWPRVVVLWLLVFAFRLLVGGGLFGVLSGQDGAPGGGQAMEEVPCMVIQGGARGSGSLQQEAHSASGDMKQRGAPDSTPTQEKKTEECWDVSPGVPVFLEEMLQRLAAARRGYSAAQLMAASAIDQTVTFTNAWDVMHYLPRAVEIGLFAPFPSDWLASGSIAVNTFLRRIVAFEMVVWYGLFPFWLLAFVRGPNRAGIGVFMTYSILSLLVFVMAITNMGTVYRMRFGFWMPLVSLALAMLVTMLEKRRQKTCVV